MLAKRKGLRDSRCGKPSSDPSRFSGWLVLTSAPTLFAASAMGSPRLMRATRSRALSASLVRICSFRQAASTSAFTSSSGFCLGFTMSCTSYQA